MRKKHPFNKYLPRTWGVAEETGVEVFHQRAGSEQVLPVWVCWVALGFLPVSLWHVWSPYTEAPAELVQGPRCSPPPARLKHTYSFDDSSSLFLPQNRYSADKDPLVQPCTLQCVGSEECLSSTRVDSRWPRHTASSSGVRPLGSRRLTSCCGTKPENSISAMQWELSNASTKFTHQMQNRHPHLFPLQLSLKLQILIVPDKKMQRKRFLCHGCRPLDS